MEIGRVTGCTRVIGKSQGYYGLPLRDEVINDSVTGPGTPCMVTAWMPTPDELSARVAWDGNHTWDQFISGLWESGDKRLLTVVNFGDTQAQCYLPLNVQGIVGRKVSLTDLLSEERYERDGTTLAGEGLYLDLPGWGLHAFAVETG